MPMENIGLSRLSCVLFLLSLLLLCLTSSGSSVPEDKYKGKVFEVTSQNAFEFLSTQDQQGILLEFYAPWCGHCQKFKSAYNDVAAELTNKGDFRVGACDITANAAMSGRFDVREIPALYLYRKGELYKYSGPFHATAVKKWATKDYVNNMPLPFWQSPLGPFGKIKGLLIHIGVVLTEFVPRFAEYFGLSTNAGAVVVAGLLGLSILSCTFVGVFFSVSHEKED